MFLQLTSNQENFGQFMLKTIENQSLIHIDSAALNALSVIPPANVTVLNKHHSVFGVLDKCRTSHGRRYSLFFKNVGVRRKCYVNLGYVTETVGHYLY